MANLITRARALYNLNNRATTSAENDTLDALIAACSAAIERHCRRVFGSQAYDELYDGHGRRELVLDRFPLVSVERVAYDPVPVLRVQNASASNQRAAVQVTGTGLSLTRVAAGVTATSTVAFAANVTLSAVAAAINALGNGWTASVIDTNDANRASADLRALQGALNAKDVNAELVLHKQELAEFSIDAGRGVLSRAGGWPGGSAFWRILYTAGFASVPEDVQEACAQWVAILFWQTKRDPGLLSESIPGTVSRSAFRDVPDAVRTLLRPYRAVAA